MKGGDYRMKMPNALRAAFLGLGVGLAALLAPGKAEANSIIVGLTGYAADATGADYTYRAVASPATTQVRPGDYFSLIDFNGYVGLLASTLGPDWVYSDPFTTPPPPNQAFADSGAIRNPLFTYVGSTFQVDPSGQTILGTFTLRSTNYIGPANNITYASQDHYNDLNDPGNVFGQNGTLQGNSGRTTGPGATSVPEPGSLALVLPGLLPLGFVLLRRRKTAQETETEE